MIRRFFGWLFNRSRFGDYPNRERLIFHYHDGRRKRRGDPLAIHRELTVNGDLEETAKVADVPTVEGTKARGQLVDAVRKAFGIPAFNDGGLLEAECLNLFVDFGAFTKTLREESRPLPNGPTPTDSPVSA